MSKPTWTPPDVRDVLSDDQRDPGPDGFGTVIPRDPRRHVQYRPAGFEDRIREQDAQARRDMLQALRQLTATEAG